jgi:8-oxo-dGTP pyrophosphatase MutT (NUDIX family)
MLRSALLIDIGVAIVSCAGGLLCMVQAVFCVQVCSMVPFIDPDIIPQEVHAARPLLPEFSDGRIDYTDAAHAPVVNVLVMHGTHILLVHRGDKVGTMKDCWHVPAGYLDEEVSLRTKALEELREELGIAATDVAELRALAPSTEELDGKSWTVYSIVVHVRERPVITIDWEHDDFAWVPLSDITQYALLPSLLRVIERVH